MALYYLIVDVIFKVVIKYMKCVNLTALLNCKFFVSLCKLQPIKQHSQINSGRYLSVVFVLILLRLYYSVNNVHIGETKMLGQI